MEEVKDDDEVAPLDLKPRKIYKTIKRKKPIIVILHFDFFNVF